MAMTIDRLVALAKQEKWAAIDIILPDICNDVNFFGWAYSRGVENEDGNVRDLAVSLLEKATWHSVTVDIIKAKLYERLVSDDNPYVRFRSAFALAAHGLQDDKVVAVLRQAEQDPELAGIARKYLVQGR